MVTTLMEKLSTRRASAAAKQIENYTDLVKAVADDKPPAVERVEAILLDSAKSPADLERDVARLLERRALTATAATLPALEKQQAALHDAVKPLRDVLAKATKD